MKEKHTIQPAGFEDAQAIFDLIRTFPKQLVPRSMSEIVQNIDRSLVAKVNADLAGTVSWRILPEMGAPRNPSIEIMSLCVGEGHQGKGVGRHLVEAALKHIRPLHPVQVVVLTFTPEFFNRLGFHDVAKEALMHKIYTGCINCTRYDSPFTCPERAMVLDLRPPAVAG